jgi:hypothetical protein
MSVHRINVYNFELWRGDPPRFHQQSVEAFTRAGVDGTAFKITAKRGDTFTAELESWWASYVLARAAFSKYLNLIGANPQPVIYNNLNYLALYKTKFQVLDIQEVDCQACVRLLGPGINYPSGARLVSRWTMVPVLEISE